MRWWAALGLCLAGCGTPPPTSACGPTTATVTRAIDGDTLELSDGQRVRMLLVDTPETTGGKMDCYGQDAAQFTASKVTGKSVQLTYDEASCKDRYGRLLAYVKVDGVELNRTLIDQGYACFLFISPGGKDRKTEFEDAESQARTSRLGVWGACAMVTCD